MPSFSALKKLRLNLYARVILNGTLNEGDVAITGTPLAGINELMAYEHLPNLNDCPNNYRSPLFRSLLC